MRIWIFRRPRDRAEAFFERIGWLLALFCLLAVILSLAGCCPFCEITNDYECPAPGASPAHRGAPAPKSASSFDDSQVGSR